MVAEWQTLGDLVLPILKHRTFQCGVESALRNAGSNPVHALGICIKGVRQSYKLKAEERYLYPERRLTNVAKLGE